MNPWSRYIASLIQLPNSNEPSAQMVLVMGGEVYERRRFESKGIHPKPDDVCVGCGAKHLTVHLGDCPLEQCPICERQLITCGCFLDRMPPCTLSILIH